MGVSTGWSVVELVSHGSSLGSGGSFFVHSGMWVSAVHPLLGPVSGGTRLGVVGSHFRESSTLVCRFEESSKTVVARYVDAGRLECATPMQSGTGPRRVEVSLNGQQFSSSGVEYTYVPSAAVSSVWPLSGLAEGGTPVTVSGSGFSSLSESLGYLRCRFNTTTVVGMYVSESLVVCNSSASSSSGYVSVEVTTNGVDYTSDGVELELSDLLVGEVSPWSGPELGGTVVTLSGSGFASSDALRCRFGDASLVSASVHSVSEARCVSPSVGASGWLVLEPVSYTHLTLPTILLV